MYQVYLDGLVLHDPLLDTFLSNGQVQITDNATGSFQFTIERGAPGYESVRLLSSTVLVLKDGSELFCGRPYAINVDLYGAKTVECEGELSYLLDSIQRPSENHGLTVRAFLERLLVSHNNQVEADKRFTLGNVTVTDSNDSLYRYTNWEDTLTCIREKLVDRLGGHLTVRKEGGVRYLDYLAEDGPVKEQIIEFGENLLDYAQDETCEAIATCIIPLGARQEKETNDPQALERYLTIESVNGGKDYIYDQSAVDRLGWVVRTVQFNDVTEPENLKRKGEEYLQSTQYGALNLSIKAIDLSLTQAELQPIRVLDQVRVISKPHGVDRYFTVLQRGYDLLDPSQDSLSLGTTLPQTIESSIVSGDRISTELTLSKAQESSAYLETVKLFSALAASSVGCYETVRTENGAAVHYWHDRPELEQSVYVRKSTANGYFISTEGPDTDKWMGIDKNANALLETLTAKCVIADRIIGGRLESQNGKTWIDMENGRFNFADNFYLNASGKAKLECDELETLNGTYRLNQRSNETILPKLLNAWEKHGIEVEPGAKLPGQAIDFLRGSEVIGSVCFTDLHGPDDSTNVPILNLYSKMFVFDVFGYNQTVLDRQGVNSSGFNVSSTEDKKEQIRAAGDALPLLKQARVYRYRLKQQAGEQRKTAVPNKYGFVIGREVPDELLSEDGRHIDLYNAIALLWKAVQELDDKLAAQSQ